MQRPAEDQADARRGVSGEKHADRPRRDRRPSFVAELRPRDRPVHESLLKAAIVSEVAISDSGILLATVGAACGPTLAEFLIENRSLRAALRTVVLAGLRRRDRIGVRAPSRPA
jgi:hypothetical protein